MVFDGFKYIAEIAGNGEELYDLRTDPLERSSLISTRPKELQRARAILKKRETLLSTGAVAPTPKNAEEPLRPEVESQLRALGYIE